MVIRVVLREPPPPKIFLEVEIFDLSKNKEMVLAFVGKGDSFEKFEVPKGAKNGGQIDEDEWTPIEGHTPSEKAFQTKLEDEWLKEEKEKKTIKIQAKRQNVAYGYDDGKRALTHGKKTDINYMIARDARMPGDKNLVENFTPLGARGKWPKDVKLSHRLSFWPTEESLAHIYVYQESEKSKYDKKKTEKVIATLNKILILQKEGEIEYVVDRFVSF